MCNLVLTKHLQGQLFLWRFKPLFWFGQLTVVWGCIYAFKHLVTIGDHWRLRHQDSGPIIDQVGGKVLSEWWWKQTLSNFVLAMYNTTKYTHQYPPPPPPTHTHTNTCKYIARGSQQVSLTSQSAVYNIIFYWTAWNQDFMFTIHWHIGL